METGRSKPAPSTSGNLHHQRTDAVECSAVEGNMAQLNI